MRKWNKKASLTLGEIARQVQAKLEGDADCVITGAAPIGCAGEGDITFVANKRYVSSLAETRASAVVLAPDIPCEGRAVLRHDNPYLTFARVIDLLYPGVPHVEPGVHNTAVIEDGATLADEAAVGPLCHIRGGASVGAGTQLVSSVFVGNDVTIGRDCLIYPGVRIMDGCRLGDRVTVHSSTVIGSDGFGFAESPTGPRKIKQVGWVEIDNDVEIGSNCSLDRGALGPTRIGAGTKIDNLVQIAHNVEIGRGSIIVSQVGISGSTRIGDGVILAGQVGLVGHIKIGDGAKVAAQSGVSRSLEPGQAVLGSPAREILKAKKIEAALTHLPELLKRVRKLEQKLTE